MLYKTELIHTENERLSSSSKLFGCFSSSLRLFFLSFFLCLFLSFSVASADYCDDFFSDNFSSSYQSYYNSARNDCDYYSCWKYGNTSVIDFFPVEGLGFSEGNSVSARYISGYPISSSVNGSFHGSLFMFARDTTVFNGISNNMYFYRFVTGSSSCVFRITVNPIVSNTKYQSVYMVVAETRTFLYGSSASTISSSSFSDSSIYYSNGTCLYQSGTNLSNPYVIESSVPQYSVDDRLKLYTTQSASLGSLLHVDLSEFYQYNNGVSSNYSFSDVVLTLDCDGTEKSFTLSPSGTQYEFLDTSTSSSRIYGYIVPYTFFSVSEYQNCSVVKVDFTRSISSPGGSGSEDFKISCDYRLKTTNINGNAQDFSSVTLAPVPSVTVSPDQSTVQDWSDNTSYKSPSFGHNGSYILLNSLPIFPDWVDKYTLDCTRVYKTVDGITLNLWIDLDNPYVSVNTALVDIPITAFFTPESYLKDNVLTDFYDVVVFKVWSDTGKTSVDGYLYFYTEKYDLKYQNNLIVQELGLEYDSLNLLSSGFSLICSGLDNIDNNTAAYFTDSLFNDTIVISWLQTLNNTNAFGFSDVITSIEDIPQYDDSSVVSGIASVVSAIEGIDSPDLSDLESKLDSLINFFVADGSTENASSRTYRNWLRGIDDDSARTVTYYADNVFSIVHDMFDLFDADGSVYYPPDSQDVVSTDYINFVKLFIEKMNSSTITNTGYNKYLRGFFQAGYDPHLIDGGL